MATKIDEIVKGVHVRYLGTGTAGRVLDTREDQQGGWAKLDSTEMWYNSRFLQVINEDEYLKLRRRESLKKRMESQESTDKEEIAKKTVKDLKKLAEDVDMSNELCDGGG